MPTVAVIYLARIAHGVDAFAPFAKTYDQFDAGFPHDLVLVGKGMTKVGEIAAAQSLFKGKNARVITTSEDGFDIHAYLRVAKQLDHDYVCFFNTYSELASKDWLAKMMTHAVTPGVGLVGASASYESIHDSFKAISKAIWLASTKTSKFDEALADQYEEYLKLHAPVWMKAASSKYLRLRRAFGDTIRDRPAHGPALDEEFERHWYAVTRDGEGMAQFRDFPRYPNPHIRSNGFLINRKLLLSFKFDPGPTKIDCAQFESGPDGLSRTVRRKGLSLILTGADGIGYPIEEWPKSKTFRLADQSNLLMSDNQTRRFSAFKRGMRELHEQFTWGGYTNPPSSRYVSLGLHFDANKSLLDFVGSKSNSQLDPMISVVIPTHNRIDLALEAISTVREQNYANYELIIFDNCSSPPLADFIDTKGDPRIKLRRSDNFLAVTESWNNAMDFATGDYVIQLGDDDGLAPGFFERVCHLVKEFDQPDLIYSSIVQFMHPGVAPWERTGYVEVVKNGFFFLESDEPFLLSERCKQKAVMGSLNVQRNFTFNIQAFVFKRSLLETIKVDGKVYQSLFPDYYLANVALAMADRIVVDPRPLSIAGVSRASFGFTLFNGLEDAGEKMLKSGITDDPIYPEMGHRLLPGPIYNTKYILTMGHVAKRLKGIVSEQPNLNRYRRLQIISAIQAGGRDLRWTKTASGKAIWQNLSIREKVWAVAVSLMERGQRFNKIVASSGNTAFNAIVNRINTGDYGSTMQVFNAIANGDLPVNGPVIVEACESEIRPKKSKPIARPNRKPTNDARC